MIPSGKGIFTWHLDECAGGDPKVLAGMAVAAGFDEVYVKILDGHDWIYPEKPILELLDELEERNLRAHAWLYTYGFRRGANVAAKEADLAAARFLFYNRTAPRFRSLIVNAEKEYQNIPGGTGRATTYSIRLRANLPGVTIGLCSYRFPTVHRPFPWEAFTDPARCDYHMPQVYWVGDHNPGQQLARSVAEMRAIRDLPIVPVGPAYAEGKWKGPSVAEIHEFNAKALELRLPGIGWWSWQHAEANADWWAALSEHVWEPGGPPQTLAERVANLEQQMEMVRAFLTI